MTRRALYQTLEMQLYAVFGGELLFEVVTMAVGNQISEDWILRPWACNAKIWHVELTCSENGALQ